MCRYLKWPSLVISLWQLWQQGKCCFLFFSSPFFFLEFEINTQLSISSVEQVLKHFMSTDTSVMRSKYSFDEMAFYNWRTHFHLRSTCSVIGLKYINVRLNQNIWISAVRIFSNQPRQWAWKRPDLSLYPTDVLLVSNQFLPAEFSLFARSLLSPSPHSQTWKPEKLNFYGTQTEAVFPFMCHCGLLKCKVFFLNILFMPSKI